MTMIEESHKIQNIEEYYFSKKLREIAVRKLKGEPVINLGIGSPDLKPPESVVKALIESVSHTTAHQYQSYKGVFELREGIASFYKRHYEVSIHAETEVLPLMGSKEGIMHISMAFLNEGDEVLVPNPGYPIYSSVTNLLNAKCMFYNLSEGNGWLPDIDSLKQMDLSKVKIMWLNYPHMPTGVKASIKLFQELIALAKRHEFLLVNDNPYSFILNDNPLSIFNAKGAKDVCLELTSLSKTFNMAGWRVGFVLGSSGYIKSILKVKTNIESGMFYGIQQGAIKALQLREDWFNRINETYKQRKKIAIEIIKLLGCSCDSNASGLFIWAKIPKTYTSEGFSEYLLNNYSIFVAPGVIFGSQGEGYIRVSLCVPQSDLKGIIQRIQEKENYSNYGK